MTMGGADTQQGASRILTALLESRTGQTPSEGRAWRMEVTIRQARTGHWHPKSYICRKLKPINYSNRVRLVAYLPLLRLRLAGKVQPQLFNLWRRMLAGGRQLGYSKLRATVQFLN